MEKILGSMLKYFIFVKTKIQKVENKNKIYKKTKIENYYLISTKNGLFFNRKNYLIKILDGEFYGIGREKYTYVYQNQGIKGRILKIDIKNDNIKNIEVFLENIDPGCHQMEIDKGKIYLTNTHKNSILIIEIKNKKITEKFPIGKIISREKSRNYGHINSIFFDNKIYLLAHNDSVRTKKNSEILIFDINFNLLDRKKTSAKSAHNIVKYDNKIIVCDSLNKRLIDVENNQTLAEFDLFTRGISINKDEILIGGSEYKSRIKRNFSIGKIYVLNKDFKVIREEKLPGMVQEIRCINRKDYGLNY